PALAIGTPGDSFTCRDGKVILPVTMGESRPLRIILDTGMTFDGLLITNAVLRASLLLTGAVAATNCTHYREASGLEAASQTR
ncbi:MAG: hypothetical protein JXB04_03975, partial [Kiritimatiellae bacterium]|nr:hypothetical protein [Kiritimatiellia bacterium]